MNERTDRTRRTRYWRPKSAEEVLTELRLRAKSARAAAADADDERAAAALRGKATGLTHAADLLGGYLSREPK